MSNYEFTRTDDSPCMLTFDAGAIKKNWFNVYLHCSVVLLVVVHVHVCLWIGREPWGKASLKIGNLSVCVATDQSSQEQLENLHQEWMRGLWTDCFWLAYAKINVSLYGFRKIYEMQAPRFRTNTLLHITPGIKRSSQDHWKQQNALKSKEYIHHIWSCTCHLFANWRYIIQCYLHTPVSMWWRHISNKHAVYVYLA